MKKNRTQTVLISILISMTLVLSACGGQGSAQLMGNSAGGSDAPADFSNLKKTGSMDRNYAECFAVDYYEGGLAMITIQDEGRFLLIPPESSAPSGVPDDVTVLRQDPKNVYLAASSAMDYFRALGALDHVRLTSTKKEDWSLPEVVSALDSGDMLYTGKYSTPDYEQILLEKCEIAIESTMIHHSPKTKEQLELLGIPVLVDRSSYEPHPLGRMEWIRV